MCDNKIDITNSRTQIVISTINWDINIKLKYIIRVGMWPLRIRCLRGTDTFHSIHSRLSQTIWLELFIKATGLGFPNFFHFLFPRTHFETVKQKSRTKYRPFESNTKASQKSTCIFYGSDYFDIYGLDSFSGEICWKKFPACSPSRVFVGLAHREYYSSFKATIINKFLFTAFVIPRRNYDKNIRACFTFHRTFLDNGQDCSNKIAQCKHFLASFKGDFKKENCNSNPFYNSCCNIQTNYIGLQVPNNAKVGSKVHQWEN